MIDLTGVVMSIDGTDYSAKQVLQFGRIGPSIEVTLFDITSGNELKSVVTYSKAVPEVDIGEIIVFKKDGYYLVLTGKDKLADIALKQMPDKIFKVRLMSSHALKKTKINSFSPPVAAPTVIKTYDSAFSNRPYFKPDNHEPSVTYKRSKY